MSTVLNSTYLNFIAEGETSLVINIWFNLQTALKKFLNNSK